MPSTKQFQASSRFLLVRSSMFWLGHYDVDQEARRFYRFYRSCYAYRSENMFQMSNFIFLILEIIDD